MRLILASKSPRRAEILRQVGLEFEIVESDADESLPENISAADAVTLLSKRKAEDVSEKISAAAAVIKEEPSCSLYNASAIDESVIIIAADTLVVLDGRFLGKPKDEADVFNMLAALRGRGHSVYTGVTLALARERGKGSFSNKSVLKSFCEETFVHMRNYSDEEIRAYIKTGEPIDKAGGYGIQGRGAVLVEKINGDYYNVVGLPIAKVCEILNEFKEETN